MTDLHTTSDALAAQSLAFTVFSSTTPPRLTKVLSMSETGELQKQPAADMQAGAARRVAVPDLLALRAALDALTPDQAVSWGVPRSSGAPSVDVWAVTTKDVKHKQHAADPTVIARSRDHFGYDAGPGVLMLDHDGTDGGHPLTVEELRERLMQACPELADAPMLWRPSSSSGIRAPDGRELTGMTRHRLYIPVTRAAGIPEAGKRLVLRLWSSSVDAPGRFAWATVGRAGQVLMRSLADDSVWQPERLDFAAAPILRDGLTRPRAEGRVFGDPSRLFDLARITVTPEQQRHAAKAREEARRAVAPRATVAREAWATEKAPELAKRRGISTEKAHAVLLRAAGETRVLMGDFELLQQGGARVTVGELLDNADSWHGARFADPLDPDHDMRVAVVNLKSGGRPFLYTHRHGGLRFELMRQSARVQVGAGRRIDATDAVLQVLRDRGELFEFGEGALAYVADGRARPVSVDWLTDHMGRACEFYRVRTATSADGGSMPVEVPEDPPTTIAKAILAKHGGRGLRQLVGVTTAPTLRLDGSVLDRPGYDADSGLFYWRDGDAPAVPKHPTPADALAALRRLWEPFRLFPLVDDVTRSVVMHGLLSAVLRASLPTAPGVGLDAPAAGSGKTLLARCIGILATGQDPAILPPADSDDETRKRLFAALRDGHRVVLWDNVREPLGNAALDSFLTATTFADRVLGASETASLPNRALFIATGNNLRLSGDTCRRVLVARMDAETETPYTRDFAFDPAAECQRDRPALVVAALTIIRAYIAVGRPKVGLGGGGSFERWNDLVRQPVCWLAGLVAEHNAVADLAGDELLPTLGDPQAAWHAAFSTDPETSKHAALLDAWHTAFSDVQTPVAAAIQHAVMDEQLCEALTEIGGQGGRLNPRIIGRWLERMQGRRVAGRFVQRTAGRAGVAHWRVRAADTTDATQPTKPTKPTTEVWQPPCDSYLGGGLVGNGGLVSSYPEGVGGMATGTHVVHTVAADEPTKAAQPTKAGHLAGATTASCGGPCDLPADCADLV